MTPVLVRALLLILAPGAQAPIALAPALADDERLLADFAPAREAWQLTLPANSEQRQPFFVGRTPLELMLGSPARARPRMPARLKTLGLEQARRLGSIFRAKALEGWPIQDEEGHLTWAFARYRRETAGPWIWLDSSAAGAGAWRDLQAPPLLPETLDPSDSAQARAIYDDFLDSDDLYFKAAYGDCVWTDPAGAVRAAWLDPDARSRRAGEICRRIAQPARLDARAVSFVFTVPDHGPAGVAPDAEEFEPAGIPPVDPRHAGRRFLAWPGDFSRLYREDVRVLSGLAPARFPFSKREMTFTRKNSADPAHELEAEADYLEERYRASGWATRRQRFEWRGIPQSNVIAVIPGRLPPALNRPVLLADHYDTAFAEDVFENRRERVSVAGADDNATATAALLRAAEALRGMPLEHDVWLVHLTGEEFPGDDLGARAFVSRELLRERREIQGLILLDMIGWRRRRDPVFQIGPGPGAESAALAAVAREAGLGLVPVIRPAFDERSYLYNTDGIIFATAGYPVILLNEHINRLENFERPHYHRSTDLPRTLDFEYAEAIVKTAIEAAARLASAR